MLLVPQEGFQQMCLACSADIALFGGAAYSGKTYISLLDAVQSRGYPAHRSVFFRPSAQSQQDSGGIWDDAASVFPAFGGIANHSKLFYKYKSGAMAQFRNVDQSQAKKTIERLKGMQYDTGYFDEVTEFTSEMFWWASGRNRSAKAMKLPYIRMTCNPQVGWVKDLIQWWLLPTGLPDPTKRGVIRYFYNLGDELVWADTREALHKYADDPKMITSFTFISGTYLDNKYADAKAIAKMNNLPSLMRQAMLDGNWNQQQSDIVFKHDWFDYYYIDHRAIVFDALLMTVDTSEEIKDYSVATLWGYQKPKIGQDNGQLFLIDMIRRKEGFEETKEKIISLVQEHSFGQAPLTVFVEAKTNGHELIRAIRKSSKCFGVPVKSITRGYSTSTATDSAKAKVKRAVNIAGHVENGCIKLPHFKHTLVKEFLGEICVFGDKTCGVDGYHDDIVDTLTDAVTQCETKKYWRFKTSNDKMLARQIV